MDGCANLSINGCCSTPASLKPTDTTVSLNSEFRGCGKVGRESKSFQGKKLKIFVVSRQCCSIPFFETQKLQQHWHTIVCIGAQNIYLLIKQD